MPEGIRAAWLVLLVSLVAIFALPVAAVDKLTIVKVGSKRFTESYILGELIAQQARSAGEAEALHLRGLGNTGIVLNALKTGDIDVYAEYTGTIAKEILKLDDVPSLVELNRLLAPMKLAVAVPLGFNNTYALAMRSEDAQKRHIARISDLANAGALRFGLSQEFIGRADGWTGLQQHYQLSLSTPHGLDHGLAYQALAQNQVDLIDVYSTDAMLEKYPLTVLQDDRQYFPRYDAVLLYRSDLPQRFPRSWEALKKLNGVIDDAAMRRMNAEAELGGKDFDIVARGFLVTSLSQQAPGKAAGPASARSWLHEIFARDFWRLTLEHLALVFIALAISIVLGVPLGIIAARRPKIGAAILAATGMLQTIPSLALLAILIPVTGRIGQVPALIALALYALLPIVRNTHTGLQQIAVSLKQAAQSLGLGDGTILRRIELPLAAATIWAGIKTSAVISVGTATIAAFVGAGGYGERIVTGLALNDNATLLAGAIPCAMLALLIEAVFSIAERWIVPAGLHTK
ncbi:MAG TPA: glycine betaine ABC transporter substrate-binding protein [Rhodocyclaceae bacterium]|nr:glycine betaine ABC transporter substrate-binding protein [Rhodocyclaceae bacterium]